MQDVFQGKPQLRMGIVTQANPLMVLVGAATTPMLCNALSSYMPTAGDTVSVLVISGDRLVLGNVGSLRAALGVVAVGTLAFNNGATTTTEGMALTNTLNVFTQVGRRYRIRIAIRAMSAVSQNTPYLELDQDGAYFGDRYNVIFANSGYNQQHGDWLIDGTGTTNAYVVKIKGLVGSPVGYSTNGHFYIEDVGPNTSIIPAVPTTVPPPAWSPLPLAGGWTSNSGTPAQYRLIGDKVELRGRMLGTATLSTMFTMPAGFRPAIGTLVSVPVVNGGWVPGGVLYVDPNGQGLMQTTPHTRSCAQLGDLLDHAMITTLCAGLPVDIFVPDTSDTRARRKLVRNPPALVTATCTECPVKDACLNFGRVTQSSGWWGGVLLHEGAIVLASGHAAVQMPRKQHHLAKLTDDQVREIRQTYANGMVTQRTLAERYGVTAMAINMLLKRRTYVGV